MKQIISGLMVATLLGSFSALAAESKSTAKANSDFDALGGNRAILDKARSVNPELSTRIVQNRMVDRNRRLEISPEMANQFGGDSYNQTTNIGLNLHYHFTPRWSLGAKYNYSFNKLTPEGKSAYDQALADFQANPGDPRVGFPLVDYPKSQILGLVNWYPIYGKMNLIDKMVAHFDVYFLGGYGQIELQSGTRPTWTTGGGMGIWWTPKLTTRLEMRYQTYTARSLREDKKLDVVNGSIQVGWLL